MGIGAKFHQSDEFNLARSENWIGDFGGDKMLSSLKSLLARNSQCFQISMQLETWPNQLEDKDKDILYNPYLDNPHLTCVFYEVLPQTYAEQCDAINLSEIIVANLQRLARGAIPQMRVRAKQARPRQGVKSRLRLKTGPIFQVQVQVLVWVWVPGTLLLCRSRKGAGEV